MDPDGFQGYDRLMKTLVVLLLMVPSIIVAQQQAVKTTSVAPSTGVVQTPTPPPGTVESSKIRLDAHDAAGALRDAETALSRGGGADAYVARGDAKRALGRPVDEVIADYAAAAKLDPRYIEKYQGLIAQKESGIHPDSQSRAGKGLNGLPIATLGIAAAAGGVLIGVGVALLYTRKKRGVL